MIESEKMGEGPRAGRPLRALFVLTSMPVGGAETLLVNLARRLDRERIVPEICCLKQPGPLGEEIAREIPVHARMIRHKYDVGVAYRLRRLMQRRQIDAAITVGAGDKMFWGRIAAHIAGVPVVLAALHSTGWPDGVGRLNRMLTRWTDRFIAVAEPHGRYLVENESFPACKVSVIPNGVDTERFRPNPAARALIRTSLGIPAHAPVFGIVAALRPEKNHALFVAAAERIVRAVPHAHFLIVGDGPRRDLIQNAARSRGVDRQTHILGNRSDIPELLAALDVFMLTSHQEANPVSILEALAAGVPVIATRVGSVAETVREGITGYLAEPGDVARLASRGVYLATRAEVAARLGAQGRRLVVKNWSLEAMVQGYERLIREVYDSKHVGSRAGGTLPVGQPTTDVPDPRVAAASRGK